MPQDEESVANRIAPGEYRRKNYDLTVALMRGFFTTLRTLSDGEVSDARMDVWNGVLSMEIAPTPNTEAIRRFGHFQRFWNDPFFSLMLKHDHPEGIPIAKEVQLKLFAELVYRRGVWEINRTSQEKPYDSGKKHG